MAPQRTSVPAIAALALLVGAAFALCRVISAAAAPGSLAQAQLNSAQIESGRTSTARSGGEASVTSAPAPAFAPFQLREPAGAERCVVCHRAEVEGYARSAMAHSLRRAGDEPGGTVETAGAKITITSGNNGYWQHLQSGGEVTNYKIDYVIGSGNHAAGYLLDLGGHLFQSPVAYYKSRQAYDLAPGYEGLANPDFTRPVAEACLFCHAGSALHVAGTSNEYRSPPFSAEAISCERCHGPVEEHLSDPRAGTIINPAKLERAARDSICEQCHLLGVGRTLNPGRNFSDFRPGEPLEAVFTTYVNALPPGAGAENFKVISHVEQLARSTCSRMSEGKLWCGTCHDPHDKPLEPVAYYRAKCLTCHTGKFAGAHPDRESNCIACHMPRRDAKDGGHTAFTEHRIQRQPAVEKPLPADVDIAAWREPAPELQKRNLGIAYVNVGGERRSPPLIVRGYQMLTEVQQQFANDRDLFTAMGTALLMGRKSQEAQFAFERALQLDPQSATAETNAASACLQGGDAGRAIAHLERALSIDPMHLPAAAPLIELYRQQGEAAKAEQLEARLSAALDKQAEQSGAAEIPRTPATVAEAEFKNIQVLKGVPAAEVIPTMRFMSASLGVECGYCHVTGQFEKDDKRPKEIARNMMRMMLAIDNKTFSGARMVTCYSCHRGSPRPQGEPSVDGAGEPAPTQASSIAPTLPSVEQLLDRYVEALGGAEAIGRIASRKAEGTGSRGGKSFRVEVFEQPGKAATVWHAPEEDEITVRDGDEGWSRAYGRALRELSSAEVMAAEMDADPHFPLNIRKLFAEVRVEYPEKAGGRETYVVWGRNAGKPPVKFYFDKESGLLVRLVRYEESPLGRDPTQIDYSDYHKFDGVEVPLRWTAAQPGGSWTVQLESVEQNVPIDAGRFMKPQ